MESPSPAELGLAAATARRDAAGLRRRPTPRTADNDGLIDCASNDYLGLSLDPRIVEGAVRAVRRWGAGSTGSRLVTGTTGLHAELERRLAAFAGMSAALVFSSGYLANLAVVTALSGPGTLVVSERRNHASIIDGCRLSRARVTVTDGPAAVEAALAGRAEERAIVVTDGVFSVDGDVAPLAELYDVTRRHGAVLVVDEAHAFGVVGRRGQGAAHAAGLAGRPDVVLTVTLSKSLGSQGGAVLARPEVIDTLVDTARPFIFDTGLAPACAGSALAALEVLAASPDLPASARSRAADLAQAARDAGLRASYPASAVVPVVLGDPRVAVRAARTCLDHGVRVGCFRPPSVPEGGACLRLTARADLREADVTAIGAALAAVKDEIRSYSAWVTPGVARQ
jgi:8-amino-7-oxononanoate synthase